MSFRLIFRVMPYFGVSGLILVACGGSPSPASSPSAAATRSVATLTEAVTEAATATLPATQTPEAPATPTETPAPLPTDTPTASPTALAFNVSGAICFPSETIPPMTAYFEETESGALFELPIQAGQGQYEVKLAAGTYIAYAWLEDFSRGGLYSRAVPCGLGQACDDHSVLAFAVTEDEALTGIDLCDWYAGPFNVPYPPGKEQTELTGSITGSLTYPEDELPSLRIVAFNLKTGYWYWVGTQPGAASYSLSQLPPGSYHVVAYDADGRAGGHAGGNHALNEVVVESGKTTDRVDVTDWEAPSGAFPEDPTR